MKSEVAVAVAAVAANNAMKRIISLLLLLCLLVTVVSCAPNNVIAPETDDPKNNLASPPVAEQKPDDTDDKNGNSDSVSFKYINPKKQKNEDIMPIADIDKAYNSLKTTELKDKELSFYVADKNAFNAGLLNEKQWMDAVSEKFGIKLNYTVRAESTLFSSQSIAMKSGIKLDIITTLAKDMAQSRSLMRSASNLILGNTTTTFSKSVFDLSGGKVFTANGMSKMMWYNKNIVSDAKAYDYFDKNEWTELTLDFLSTDIRGAGKNIIECDNWAAFGSAAGIQATGIANDGSMVLALENTNTINSFLCFSKIFKNQVADKKNTFKNGGTAFCYTDSPVLSEGELGFVPVPAIYGKGEPVCEFSGVGMGISASADDISAQTALTFLLLWSARYSEARADDLVYTYGLSPKKANKYIEFTETNGKFYNADRQLSSYFETKEISESLIGDEATGITAYQSAYDRTVLLNLRNQ